MQENGDKGQSEWSYNNLRRFTVNVVFLQAFLATTNEPIKTADMECQIDHQK